MNQMLEVSLYMEQHLKKKKITQSIQFLTKLIKFQALKLLAVRDSKGHVNKLSLLSHTFSLSVCGIQLARALVYILTHAFALVLVLSPRLSYYWLITLMCSAVQCFT